MIFRNKKEKKKNIKIVLKDMENKCKKSSNDEFRKERKGKGRRMKRLR